MRKSFQLISDPSQGWLKVPLAELSRLGIQDKISACSYVKGVYAFLEEDADMQVFADARNANGEAFRTVPITRDSCRKIRNYEAYSAGVVPLVEVEVEVSAETDAETSTADETAEV